jgi:hypothetical protein
MMTNREELREILKEAMKSKDIKYHSYFENMIELIDDNVFNKMLSLEQKVAEDLKNKERDVRLQELSIEEGNEAIRRLKKEFEKTQEEVKFNNVQTDTAKEAIRLFSAIAEIAKEDDECFRYASYIVYAFLNNAKENGCE